MQNRHLRQLLVATMYSGALSLTLVDVALRGVGQELWREKRIGRGFHAAYWP